MYPLHWLGPGYRVMHIAVGSYQLTPKFELWFNIFVYRHFHATSEIASVRPYPEKRNQLSFVNISPTFVINTSMERSSRVLRHKLKIWFFKGKTLNWVFLLSCFVLKNLAYAVHIMVLLFYPWTFKLVSTCTYITINDIRDASLSLLGSASIIWMFLKFYFSYL